MPGWCWFLRIGEAGRGAMSFDEINPLWRIADILTVEQAASLVAGSDPNHVRFNSNNAAWFESETGLTGSDGIGWVQTAFAALTNAINAGRLPATIRRDARIAAWDEWPSSGEQARSLADDDDRIGERQEPIVIYREAPDWGRTTVKLEDLKAWLASRGFTGGFFFPESTDAPDYLNPSNPRYSHKLAAAVRAWQAVTDPGGKSPKQALMKWLREHAAEFGMVKDDGNPYETAVEEVGKVANWDTVGGAPKTPGG